jgi:hypothetical protein
MMIYIKTILITTFTHILVLHPFQYPDGSTNVEESADELIIRAEMSLEPRPSWFSLK